MRISLLSIAILVSIIFTGFSAQAAENESNGSCTAFFNKTNNCPNVNFADFSFGTFPVVGWLWTFGDGDSSFVQNPTHTYQNNGTYMVCLSIVTQDTCTATFCDSVQITCQGAAVCQGGWTNTVISCGNIGFTDASFASPGSVATWSWDFGDGNSSSLQNPSHTYTVNGTYNVCQTIVTTDTCSSFFCDTVVVTCIGSGTCAANWSNSSISCPNISFTDMSTASPGSVNSWNWSFGDGNSSTVQNPSHTYVSNGTYNTCLTIGTTDGCSNTFCDTVQITCQSSTCTAGWTNNPGFCPSMNFTDISTSSTGFVNSWTWDFGDGNSSSQQNPTHNYSANATYTVCLTIGTSDTCSATFCDTVQVTCISATCSALYNANLFGCPSIPFTDMSSSSPGTVASWLYDFGDGTTSTQQNPVHNYVANGTYYACLTILTSDSCTDQYCDSLNINCITGPACNSDFSFSNGICPNVNFSDMSTAAPGNVNSWNWNFGDGNTSTAQNPTHTYSANGTYTVCLSIGTTDTCSTSKCYQVSVTCIGAATCQANFSSDTSFCPTVTFSDSSVSSPGTVAAWNWNFGDGNTSTTQSPSHNYTSNGAYNVCLSILSLDSCVSTYCDTVYVTCIAASCNAGFTSNLAACPNVAFSDMSTSSPGTINSYFWQFGDGGISTLQSPQHTYVANGTYNVCLTISTTDGCNTQFCDSITISCIVGPACNSDFIYSLGSCPSIAFQDQSASSPGSITQWQWNFGDGGSDTVQNPTYVYTANGSYNVCLTITTADTCTSISCDSITITCVGGTVCNAGFTTNVLGCPTIAFTDTSSSGTGSVNSWFWDFGDGNNSVQQNPTHIYTINGTYSVKLIINTTDLCADTVLQTVVINCIATTCNSDFAMDTSFCPMISFTDSSTSSSGSVNSWLWDFGDGNSSTAQNPTNTYAANGTYTVCLLIMTTDSCIDSTCKSLTFGCLPPPSCNAAFNQFAPVCPSVNFSDQSTANPGTVNSWAWDFGDGGSSTQQNPTHTYANNGTYTACLIINTSQGCIDTVCNPVIISCIPTCDADFIFSPGICPVVNFTDTSSANPGTVTSYLWDFGDATTDTVENPSHTFLANGTYNVCLTITTSDTCIDTTCKSVVISCIAPPSCNTGFTVNATGCPSISFTDTSSSSPGTIVSWNWDFGDGNSATTQNVNHTYAANGNYTVCLETATSDSCKDTACSVVNINCIISCAADFGFDAAGCPTIAFSDSSVASPGTVNFWSWNFGDGNTSSVKNPSHTYAANGNYNVTLIISTTAGCVDTVVKSVNINCIILCNSGFFVNGTSCPTFGFTDNSTASPGTVNSWNWTFGDGNSSTSPSPTHTYASNGTYTVTLIIGTTDGCVDTATQVINISCIVGCTSNFNFNATSCPVIAYTDASSATGTINSWTWDFGDGNSSTAQSPSHTYAANGTYVVCLTIATTDTCTNTFCDTVPISCIVNCNAAFTANTAGCPSIAFTDSSTASPGTVNSWNWTFGDGNSSTAPNPTHVYTANGTYTVTLIMGTTDGCVDTTTQTVNINCVVSCNATFGFNLAACPNISFTDGSTASPGNVNSWNWDFGDGNTSTAQNPSHTYVANGTYTAILIIGTSDGCADTAMQTVNINCIVTCAASFTVDTSSCPSIAFTDASTAGPGTVNSWNWDFGDGNSSTAPNPSHSYTSNGGYTVCLIIGTSDGCNDTLCQTVQVSCLPGPTCQASYNVDTTNCPTIGFTSTSTASPGVIVGYLWTFGDGDSAFVSTANHTYAANGTYTVCLTIVSSDTCTSTVCNPVNINCIISCNAAFAFDTTNCPIVAFTDGSSAGPGTVNSWNWDFGDGNSSTAQSPSHTYSANGTYTVSLIIGTTDGCNDTTTQTVTISCISSCTASFTTSTFSCPLISFFDGSSTSPGTITSWLWDFGDGGGSTQQNPNYTYTANGSYTVCLIIGTSTGCVDTVCQTVNINCIVSCGAGYTVNTTGCPNYAFTDISTASPGNVNSWSWDFGDGNSSTTQSPTNTYAANGNYTVCLVIGTSDGCIDTLCQTVNVNCIVSCTSAFAVDTTNCPTIGFTDNSTAQPGNISSWSWAFGDGNSSTAQSPSHTYTNNGTFNVCLTTISTDGCTSTVCQNVIITCVAVTCNSAFTMNSASCPLVNFNDASTASPGTITSWNWDFGDGGSSSSQFPAHIYNANGNYTVCLVITTSDGCVDTTCQTLNINCIVSCNASFVFDTTNCPIVAFTDASTAGPGNVSSYNWDFGDGNSSTATNPSHTYANNGSYTVCLIIGTTDGCNDTTCQTVTVSCIVPTCNSSFTVDTSLCPTVSFFDASTAGPGTVNSWSWDFGDGNTSTAQNPSNNYASNGGYVVCLVIGTTDGCIDTACQTVQISCLPGATCQASYTVDTSSCPAIGFTSTSSASPGIVVGYLWTFGDGDSAFVANPNHTYSTNGAFTVCLTIVTSDTCTSTVCNTVNISCIAVTCGAGFNVNSASCPTYSFTDTSTASPGNVNSWTWDFGDGGGSNSQNPSYTYTANGTYTVCLTIGTTDGCSDTVCQAVSVTCITSCGAVFTTNSATCPTIGFTDGSTSSPGTVNSWSWDFGDGNSSTTQSPSHTYTANGNYTVTLIIGTTDGCIDTTTQTININCISSCNAAYTINGASCPTYSFTDGSTASPGTVNSWSWTFGDGNSSSLPNPTNTYAANGSYTVVLVIGTTDGCIDTMVQTVNVNCIVTCNAAFTSSLAACPTVNFTDGSSAGPGNVNSWNWDFGDGNSSTVQNPTHTYTANGTYTVTLIIGTTDGCADTVTQTLNITCVVSCNAAFTVNGASCPTYTFTDGSTSGPGAVNSWSWNFGDGNSSTAQSPTHTYTANGTYTVTLLIGTVDGCTDTVSQTVNVTCIVLCNAVFTFDTTGCPTVAFTDGSTASPGTVNSWSWDFGDGNSSTAQSPSNTYTANGGYLVCLVIGTTDGCIDSICQTVQISCIPGATCQAGFTTNTATCPTIGFTSTSTSSPGTISSYAWAFGDGNSSSAQNPSHTYTANGSYNVCLTIITTDGCTSTVCQTVNINCIINCNAAFTFNTASCPTIVFTDGSTASPGSVNSWNWNFGDGNSSTAPNPTNTYTANGAYTVTLIIGTTDGCIDTVSQTVNVNCIVTCNANFNFNASSCPLVNFSDMSTAGPGTVTSWNWDFGDGNGSAAQFPAHLYSANGNYTVCLLIGTSDGCTDTICKTVTINCIVTCNANFSVNSTLCPQYTFTDGSTAGPGTVNSWSWTFGDGNSSTAPSPTHTYAANGSYTVTLITGTTDGCVDTTSQTVNVNCIVTCNAAFTVNSASCPTHIFTDGSTAGPGAVTSWNWTFGDGNSSTAQSPTHTYTANGTYTVTLIIGTSDGCSDTVTQTVNVTCVILCNAAFTADTSGCPTVAFTDASTASPGTVNSWNWNFGDGNTSTAPNPSNTYAANGGYVVCLVIGTTDGCVDSICQTVQISCIPGATCQAAFTQNAAACPTIAFTSTSTSSPGTISSYSWAFGDGNSSTTQNPTHTYAANGSYSTCLTIITTDGCTSTVCQTVNINCIINCNTSFSINTSSCPTIVFTDGSTASPGTVNSWNWTFGDGNSSSAQNPTNTYAANGTYTVTLITGTTDGCIDTATQVVNITCVINCNAAFTANGTSCPTFAFSDGSTAGPGSVNTWNWNFGDGNGSTSQNPSHTYAANGTYTVTLIIGTSDGCIDTATQVINVTCISSCNAAYTFTLGLCPQVSFFDGSTASPGSVNSWSWTFGDGNSSTAQNPNHTYTANGNYTVTLIIGTTNGCIDTVVQTVNINCIVTCKATFTVNSTLCPTYSFADASTAGPGTVTTWSWTFGDGNSSTTQSPSHTYAANGSYTVTLIIGTSDGCSDTLSQTVNVNCISTCNAAFTIDSSQCPTYTFTDGSTTSPGIVNSWSWNFGDGNSSSVQNPSHTYAANGPFTVTLIIGTSSGCSDTVSQVVNVNCISSCAAAFTFNTATCPLITFTDGSTASPGTVNSWSWDFGDGNSSSTQNPSNTYAANGTYTVCLTIGTSDGCTDTICKTVTINCIVSCNAAFTANTSNCPVVAFTDGSTASPGTVTGWSWDFGDGNTSTTQNPSNTYSTNGTYSVCLVITTSDGCMDTVCQTIAITCIPALTCTASFTADTSNCPTVSFTNTSTSSPGIIVANLWDFGDGGQDSSQSPSHTYTANGTYIVCLTIVTSDTCTSTFCDTISINCIVPPTCQADFSADTSGCPTVSFTDLSTSAPGAVTAWNWAFGDGGTSTLQSPNHLYTTNGTYTVCLSITTADGCLSSHCDTITISCITGAVCNADFTYGYDSIAGCPTVNFTDLSAASPGTVLTWAWNFGDGNNDTTQNPQHTYAPGTYLACLTITTSDSCTSTYCDSITIFCQPLACESKFAWAFDSLAGCPTVNFTDSSKGGPGASQVVSWAWDFGDGTTDTMQNTTHMYATNGMFIACLTIVTNDSCTHTYCDTVNITCIPVICDAGFTMDTSNCPDIVFTDTSTATPGSIISWSWDFGDSTTSSAQNPTHTYTVDSIYIVCLTIMTDDSCTSTICDTVEIDCIVGREDNLYGLTELTIYPNPANEGTQFRINLSRTIDFGYEIYSAEGKLIKRYEESTLQAGIHQFKWNTDAVSQGIYMVRFRIGDNSVVRRVSVRHQ